MEKQIRRLFAAVVVMFVSLLIAVTWIQYVDAPQLNADGRNSRAFYRVKYSQRGPIYVGDEAVAQSVPLESDTGYRKRYQRVYSPNARKYSHLIGYITVDGLSAGLEKAENSVLTGQAPTQFWAQVESYLQGKTHRGGGIRLTINPKLQQALLDSLEGKLAAGVVLNYKTGAVLASVSLPDFDPAELAKLNNRELNERLAQLNADPTKPMLNRALNGEYAPGSSFKVVDASLILKEGLATPDQKVYAPQFLPLPGTNKPLSNYDNSFCGNGHPPFYLALANSCNTPFADMILKIGQPKLVEQAEAFGFNSKKLNIPLPVSKSIFPTEQLAPAFLAYSSIGQYTVQSNAMQMAIVAQAIANNGTMLKPFLVAQDLDADGKVVKQVDRGEVLGNPISPEVAEQLKSMMVKTIEIGSGVWAKVPDIHMGAKTGTAQVEGRPGVISNGWFIGWADVGDNPLAFALFLEGTQNEPNPHGGKELGPVVKKIVEAMR